MSGEGSQAESKFAQFQHSLNEFLHDPQNPFAQIFALAEKYSQNRVKRTHAFWGKLSMHLECIVICVKTSIRYLSLYWLVSSVWLWCSVACQLGWIRVPGI